VGVSVVGLADGISDGVDVGEVDGEVAEGACVGFSEGMCVG